MTFLTAVASVCPFFMARPRALDFACQDALVEYIVGIPYIAYPINKHNSRMAIDATITKKECQHSSELTEQYLFLLYPNAVWYPMTMT